MGVYCLNMRDFYKFTGWVLLLLMIIVPIRVLAQDVPQVLITSVKLGGIVEGEPTEFIKLSNTSTENVDLTGWTVEYIKPTAKITDCNNINWASQDISSASKSYQLSGEIMAGQTMLFELALNDNSGGSLHLTNGISVMDLVGWGNSVSAGLCKETNTTNIPNNKTSINRKLNNEGQFVDTNNNLDDFINSAELNLPDGNNIKDEPQPVIVCSELNCEDSANQQTTVCSNVELTEIVPNPVGSDTGNEYFELFNSAGQPTDLTGCSIKIGSNTKQLTGIIKPGYNAYFGSTLPNASGATVELITATTEDVVSYPPNMEAGQSWSLVDGEWQLSDQSTPSAENIIIVTPKEASTQKSSEDSNKLEPCTEGKYRNPETNRCKTIEAENELKDCEAGQERNPETNRCRKTATLLAGLKECSVGQVRNPETNRCRKASITTASLTACKEGQERNPATNRCRKVAGVTTDNKNTNNSSKSFEQELQNKQNISYGIFVAMAVLVLGYGLYEYRDNITNYFAKLRTKSSN